MFDNSLLCDFVRGPSMFTSLISFCRRLIYFVHSSGANPRFVMAVATGSGIDLEDVKEVVTCGICLQLYADPRRLRCSHTFCLQCLNEYQSTQTWKECPTCRTDCIPCQNDLEKLPVDQQAIDLIGLVKMYDPTVVGKSVKMMAWVFPH